MNNDETNKKYNKILDLNDTISNKILKFIENAHVLEDISNYKFKLKNSFELNKIMLQGYILNSDLCISLKENYNKNYSIIELKNFIRQYAYKYNDNSYFPYLKAIELYDFADMIEELIENKISTEIILICEFDDLYKLDDNIYSFDNYIYLKNKFVDLLNMNILSSKLFNFLNFILDDVYNFYKNGYPLIINE